MNGEISVADFLEENRDEVRFEDGEFIYPEKEIEEPETVYESYTDKTSSGLEKCMAKAYASTVTGGFGVAQAGLKTVYRGLRFLATR